MSKCENLSVGNAVRLRSPKASLAIAALAIATMLSNPSSVQADFRVALFADQGVLNISTSDPARPVALSASGGTSDLSASAGGFADVGPIGVSIQVVNTSQRNISPVPEFNGVAQAAFSDVFTVSLPGQQGKAGTIVFTFSLHGGLSAEGEDDIGNVSFASVHATGGVTDQVRPLFFLSQGDKSIDFSQIAAVSEDNDPISMTVSQNFTIRLPVLLGLDNEVSLNMGLSVGGSAADSGAGSASADLADPFMITSVQLFDDQGQFLENVGMTDSFGNMLQVGSPAAVPEPSALALLGIGAVSLLGYSWRRKRAA
jgi:PEP-CTERM motif